MCRCKKVTFYEVDFKTVGLKVVPNCKTCGEFLDSEQAAQFEKELVAYWGTQN
jgi:uncharacterized protein (DUF983 family)